MKSVLTSVASMLALMLAGCGASSPSEESDDTSASQPASSPEEAAAPSPEADAILASLGTPWSEADLANGERVYRRCQSCHTLEDGARHLVGPNLYDLFNRTAGSADSFRYSSALEEADFVWTPEQLDQWLANPREFLPGNRMSFAGLRDETQRWDVIGYIAVETASQ